MSLFSFLKRGVHDILEDFHAVVHELETLEQKLRGDAAKANAAAATLTQQASDSITEAEHAAEVKAKLSALVAPPAA